MQSTLPIALAIITCLCAPAGLVSADPAPPVPPEARSRLLEEKTVVELHRGDDDVIDISGLIYIRAARETIWEIISDYNNLAGTLPKVRESRVVSENGNVKIVDQTSKTGVLFVRIKFRALSEVTEIYPEKLAFELIAGDFELFSGAWHLVPWEEGTLVSWSARVKPVFSAPGFIVDAVQKRDLRQLLEAIRELAEAESPADDPAQPTGESAAFPQPAAPAGETASSP